MNLPRPKERYSQHDEEQRNQAIEQADRQNWKKTGDETHPHALTVLGTLACATGAITSGVYTPTVTEVANLDASTIYECQYMRVGDVVTVSGRFDVDPTGAGSTVLDISLPIASDLASDVQCCGCAFASGVAGQGAAIQGNSTDDRAQARWIAVDTTNQAMYFTFTYRVV